MELREIGIGNLSKTAEDGDGKVCKTRRLITQDKKRTWMCEIKLAFMPSCSQVRLQLLHWFPRCLQNMTDIVQELTSNVSFRKRRWSQRNFSENRKIQGNQSKDILSKTRGLRRNVFLASRRWCRRPRLLKVPNREKSGDLTKTRNWLDGLTLVHSLTCQLAFKL